MAKRYLIIVESTCPDCDGDGWRITEDEWDACPACRGDGFVTEQVAELSQAQVLPYLTAIPFMGEPVANPERLATEINGLESR